MTAPANLPARRPRRDGWTADKQEAFLTALATCGCVTHACRVVGMSRESAYNLYNRESAVDFRRGWEAALDCSLRLLEDEMWSRAIKGVPRPVFYQGEQVGEYRHFDERLAMFLLRFRRPHRYAELPKIPPPILPPGCEDDGPDPDEPIGFLGYHLGGLVDDERLPGEPPTIDGVNFVNLGPSGGAQREDCGAIVEQREQTAQCPADHRPEAEWIDGADSLRAGKRSEIRKEDEPSRE